MSNLYKNILYLAFVFSTFIIYGYYLGDDAGPDLQNYHFYLGYLGLNQERLSTDILAGDINSYFNPYYYSFFYYLKTTFSSVVVNGILSLIHSFNFIILFFLAKKIVSSDYMFSNNNPKSINILSILIALIGVTNPFFLSMIGASWIDNFIPILIFLALYFYIDIFIDDNLNNFVLKKIYIFKHIFIPGLLFGITLGMKLTVISFAIPFFLSIFLIYFIREVNFRFIFKLSVLLSSSILFGFLLSNGLWMYRVYSIYDNPLFPFFNEIFKSKKIVYIFTNQPAWAAAKNLLDYFVMPINWARGIPNPSEWNFRDHYYVLLYSCFFIWLLWVLTHAKKILSLKLHKVMKNNIVFIFISLFFLISYIIWLMRFGALRYFVPGSFLLGFLFFFFLNKVGLKSRYIILILIIFITLNLKFNKNPPFGRLSWDNAWYENTEIDPILVNEPHLFMTPGVSFIFPLLNKDAIFYKFNQIDEEDELFITIKNSVTNPKYPLRTITSWPWINQYDNQLKLYNLKRDFTDCVLAKARNVQSYQSCKIVKSDKEITIKYPVLLDFSEFHMPYVNEVVGIDRNWNDSNYGKGNWSIGKDAKIVLNFDLPKKFELVIETFPFNKNSEEIYTIQVGEDIRRFNFKDTESQNHRIEFTFLDVHDNLNEIIFNIPNPTSPASISTSKDHRELGLFIKNIYINEIKYN